ncbi:Hypothetical predicted protein [Podarcis lilfordi]|uniref:Uncharacterized protein n=1 Tax=Podarcis lilfordi TaxID=74358 RepID=A0AA35KSQ0_9SAUR|nr:Hypothetical predicted protein [Podarcis lilfordi]
MEASFRRHLRASFAGFLSKARTDVFVAHCHKAEADSGFAGSVAQMVLWRRHSWPQLIRTTLQVDENQRKLCQARLCHESCGDIVESVFGGGVGRNTGAGGV